MLIGLPVELSASRGTLDLMHLKPVNVHSAAMFHCPQCEGRNFFREIKVDAAPDALVPGTDIPYGGSTDWPPEWFICQHCGYNLTQEQQRIAKPMDADGGVALPAWFFNCELCGARRSWTRRSTWEAAAKAHPESCSACIAPQFSRRASVMTMTMRTNKPRKGRRRT